jgi:hypothetical protein
LYLTIGPDRIPVARTCFCNRVVVDCAQMPMWLSLQQTAGEEWG